MTYRRGVHGKQGQTNLLYLSLIGDRFNFVLIDIDIEYNAEDNADELCYWVRPPNRVDIARKGEEVSHGEQRYELTSDGDEH